MKLQKRTIEIITPSNRIKLYEPKIKTYQETKQILHRLYTQTSRRPSILLINIIQPLLWLLMFGALFQNAPIYLFENHRIEYKNFLNPGIIVFTAFSSSLNAGLTIIFDREFGFLNKILISPISNKTSIVYASILHTWIITMIQVMGIIAMTYNKEQNYYHVNLPNLFVSIIITSTVIISISNISIYSAFILPGHIEFIGLTTLFLNLPTLFTSTALAPLSFMPHWLQLICCINPLTYAIEIIRNIKLNDLFTLEKSIINISLIPISGYSGITILFTTSILSFILVKKIIQYKYDKN
uniref:ABC transmembrane type-2 domain-containing protein n=1 Tax=Polysiphonia infestans TaxID=2006978 RepID=A0A1Z1MEG9_9FLOR|nr:hypothetical protein [Polysiphonia infestans]ARW64430.1 hypothetical protein [Polysiphonia infestans]